MITSGAVNRRHDSCHGRQIGKLVDSRVVVDSKCCGCSIKCRNVLLHGFCIVELADEIKVDFTPVELETLNCGRLVLCFVTDTESSEQSAFIKSPCNNMFQK